jgi:hypothetical protein
MKLTCKLPCHSWETMRPSLLVPSLFLFLLPSTSTGSADLPGVLRIGQKQASNFARLALKGIRREFPHEHMDDRRGGPSAGLRPRSVHPAFYGCYDWHSCVHNHWLLVRLLRRFPDLPEKRAIRKALAEDLTPDNLRTEANYFAEPGHLFFERPYGWAWLLKLAEELNGWDDSLGRELSRNLKPLTEAIVDRYLRSFPGQRRPNRSGLHSNTALGLAFAHDYARSVGHAALLKLVEDRSKSYFAGDKHISAESEPGRADFLSPSLTEADLMRRILPAAEFRAWLSRCLPDLARGKPSSLFQPATVHDRRDPQLLHLDGLNLSRAWCMLGIASSLAPDSAARKLLIESAAKHARAALPHVSSGDFAGEHWLPSFAVFLLTGQAPGV